MILEDDRTPEQMKTHTILVVGTDSFMSGWGCAAGGVSYAAFACTIDTYDRVYKWVLNRKEMKRVRIVDDRNNTYRPKAAHTHIFVVDENHRALKGY